MLGVDASPDGWVGLAPDPDHPRVYSAPTLAALLERAAADGPLACVGVDIPIGLPDAGERAADRLARGLLGARRSSLFTAPVRSALELTDYAAAVAQNRAVTGQGFSRQAFGLRTKVLEVDAYLPTAGVDVREVHPELSFATMAGAPMRHSKKTWAGAVERQARLAEQGIVVDARLAGSTGRAGVDDVLDAAAAAWTARRCVAGLGRPLPDPPEPGAGTIWR